MRENLVREGSNIPDGEGVILWGMEVGLRKMDFGSVTKTEPWPETYSPESVLYATVYEAPSHMPIFRHEGTCLA